MHDTTYEPFSKEPEYLALNRAFIERLDWTGRRRILDLACGTLTLTEVILERAPEARITGVDYDPRQLEIARSHFAGPRAARLDWVHSPADELPLPDAAFDACVMGNAIHMLPDLPKLLREVRRVLRPGGRFSFNTSFYAGTFAPGTEGFYLAWMKEALKGLPGSSRRVRGTVPHANARPWLSPAEFRALLEEAGFRFVSQFEHEVPMGRRAFETIGAYYGLARVLLSGYPVEEASRALSASVARALEAQGRETVPRLWLEMTGERA